MAYKFLVYARQDHVGVAIEDIQAGETAEGFFLEDNSTATVEATQDIPLGHKISLFDLEQGAAVTKYGETIGKASAMIKAGDHVHVHNLESTRQI